MNTSQHASQATVTPRELAAYQTPSLRKSLWQLANSLIPYLALWVLMVKALAISYWLVLPLAVIAAGFLVRIFIIFHDCGHGSFFKSRQANEIVGFFCGVLTLTPAGQWWKAHAMHHATAGDLDRRGIGDVWTMTIEEYQAAPRFRKLMYWFFRTPVFMLGVGPILMFVLVNRFPGPTSGPRERMGVLLTNIALALIITALSLTIGFKTYAIIHATVFIFSGIAGVWLFYVQHQFDDVYWRRHDEWDYMKVGLEGSSFYKLPKVLQWFSGNIGFHHVHHLNPRIPNYALEDCHRNTPGLWNAPTLTLRSSFKTLGYRLWDEKNRRMVGFAAARMRGGIESGTLETG